MVHESKSLASEKRLLKEIKGSQKLQEEDDSFASFCTQCEADLAYVTKHVRLKIKDKSLLKVSTY